MTAPGQLALTFPTGLLAQFRNLREVTAATVYASRKGVKGVAADLDLSPSDLVQRLNAEGAAPRPLRVEDLEGIIGSTGDLRPVYWLIERYCADPDAARDRALSQLNQLLPAVIELAKAAGVKA